MRSLRRPSNQVLLGSAAALAVIAWAGASSAAAAEGHATAGLIADTAAIVPGQPFRLGVLFDIEEGWHIYWENPGEAGLATAVEWSLPEGFQAGSLRWPVPRTFDQGGGIAGYGYEEAVLLWSRVRPPETLRVGTPVTVGAEVSWLACKTLCVPGRAQVERTLPVAGGAQPANRELFSAWEQRLPVPAESRRRLFEEHVHGGIPPDAKTGQFHVLLTWREERGSVAWLPAPPEGLLVDRVSVRHEGKETHLEFTATRVPAGAEGPLPSLIIFETEGGRHGVALPIPLRAEAHRSEHEP